MLGPVMTEGEFAMCEFARMIERDRNELRRDVAALLNALPKGAHDVTEGVGTIRAMREAIKEAHKALGMCAGVIGAPLDTEWKSVEECDASHNAAIAALAKLQPFLK